MDMDTLGFFIFMDELEREEVQDDQEDEDEDES